VLVRLSEVTDWEEGGRTSTQAAARIFDKEAADGPRQVLTARREVRTCFNQQLVVVCSSYT